MSFSAKVLLMIAFYGVLISCDRPSLGDNAIEMGSNKSDKRLFGQWEIVECVGNGADYLAKESSDPLAVKTRDALSSVIMVIDESRIRTVFNGETQDEIKYVVECVDSACNLDTFHEKKERRDRHLWIYKFSNDKLILAGSGVDRGRPKVFKSTPGSGITRLVLKQIKNKKSSKK